MDRELEFYLWLADFFVILRYTVVAQPLNISKVSVTGFTCSSG